MRKIFSVAVLLAIASTTFAALPDPDTLPKNGDCPTAYTAKGDQCVPTPQARFAIQKSEVCPNDYEEDGNYCVATAAAKLAMRRAAMRCPSGFTGVGNYCLSDK